MLVQPLLSLGITYHFLAFASLLCQGGIPPPLPPPVAALLSSLLLVDIGIVFLVFPTPPFVESSIPISAVGGKSNPKVVI